MLYGEIGIELFECPVLGGLAGVLRTNPTEIEGEQIETQDSLRFFGCLDKDRCGISLGKGKFDWQACPACPQLPGRAWYSIAQAHVAKVSDTIRQKNRSK